MCVDIQPPSATKHARLCMYTRLQISTLNDTNTNAVIVHPALGSHPHLCGYVPETALYILHVSARGMCVCVCVCGSPASLSDKTRAAGHVHTLDSHAPTGIQISTLNETKPIAVIVHPTLGSHPPLGGYVPQIVLDILLDHPPNLLDGLLDDRTAPCL